jgi:hypothetical protein
MFGFGSGRIGPDDKFLTDFERAVRQGRATSLPRTAVNGPCAGTFRHLRDCHRPAVVTLDECAMVDFDGVVHPPIPVSSLPLPAEQILFEVAVSDDDPVRRRVVWAARHRSGEWSGDATVIECMSLLRMRDGTSVFTLPVAASSLDDLVVPLPKSFIKRSIDALLDGDAMRLLETEALIAVLGLRAISAREDAKAATRH